MQSLLVTGEMRSGTTFIANFLNSQDNAIVYADMLVRLFMEAHALNIQEINQKLSTQQKNILLSNLIQEGKLHHLDFSGIDRDRDLTWLDLFHEGLSIIQGDDIASLVGVKRTREEDYLSQLMSAGTKVIYCVRDPRDVVISAKNRFAGFDLFNSAENWQKSVRSALSHKQNANFLIVRFEDLILKKQETADRLSSFLGLPIKVDFEEFHYGRDRKYRDNSSFGDVKKLFDPSATYRWKSQQDHASIHFVERLLSWEMAALDYETQGRLEESSSLWKAYKREKFKKALLQPIKRIYRR